MIEKELSEKGPRILNHSGEDLTPVSESGTAPETDFYGAIASFSEFLSVAVYGMTGSGKPACIVYPLVHNLVQR